MSPAAEHLFQALMALTPADRAAVLDAVEDAADPAPTELPASYPLWKDELARRSAAVDAGLVKCVPGDEVLARVRKRVGLDG